MERSARHRALALVVTVAAAVGVAHVPIARPRGEPWNAPAPRLAVLDAATILDAAVDPNVAPLDALERLPGVGPAIASRITSARDAGPFCRPEDLRRVRGIGPRMIARLRPHLSFADPRCVLDAQ